MRQVTVPPTLSETPELRRTHFGNVLDKAEEIMQLLISAVDTSHLERIPELTLLPEHSTAAHFIRYCHSYR